MLPGPICWRLVGAVGTGSLLLPPVGASSSSLMITERRTSVVLSTERKVLTYLGTGGANILAYGLTWLAMAWLYKLTNVNFHSNIP